MFKIIKELIEDAKNIKEKDPACKSIMEVIILYPGFHILVSHRLCHLLYKHKLYFVVNGSTNVVLCRKLR